MSDPVLRAVHGALRDDAGVGAILGDRLFDRVPDRARTPYLLYGATEGVPLDAEGTRAHALTIEVWSRLRGRREVAQALEAVRAALDGAALAIAGYRTVDCRVVAQSSRPDGLELHRGTVRLRIVTEPID